MKPKKIRLSNIFKKQEKAKIKIKTLGGKSEIEIYEKRVPEVFCKNSRGNEYKISGSFNEVLKRYVQLKRLKNLKKHLVTSNYNANKWPKAPDRNFSPYIAAIIAFLDNEHPSYKKSPTKAFK